MKRLSIFLILFSLNIVFMARSLANSGVARVILFKGNVTAKLTDGSSIALANDVTLPEGTTLQTLEKSFVKLIFIDKSQMNLGPNSQMVITAFPKKEAGIITLVKGQLRSQVSKDYMDIEDKNKSKLYIKSKTAALGIRGTDFQVNFNPENMNTSLITFEGKVAMANIDRDERETNFDQSKLEKVVSSEKAVLVEKGQISAVNLNIGQRAMEPTLLGVKQLDALKENETGVKETQEDSKKQFRNPLPPGVDGTLFSNITPEKNVLSDNSSQKDPNGFFNNKTGEYKLPAGSIIDLNTVNIIPPPVNAVFDPNSKTFIVPESFGQIDKLTGEYRPPAGLMLGNDGKFIIENKDAFLNSQKINKEDKKEEKKEDKKEESKNAIQNELPQQNAPISVEVPNIFETRPELTTFQEKYSSSENISEPATKTIDPNLQEKAQEVITSTETVKQTTTETGTTKTSTRVKIIFDAQ